MHGLTEFEEIDYWRKRAEKAERVVEAARAVLAAESPTRELSTEAHCYRVILVAQRQAALHKALDDIDAEDGQ